MPSAILSVKGERSRSVAAFQPHKRTVGTANESVLPSGPIGHPSPGRASLSSMIFSTPPRSARWGITFSLLGLVVACGGHSTSPGAAGGNAGSGGGGGQMCGGQLCSAGGAGASNGSADEAGGSSGIGGDAGTAAKGGASSGPCPVAPPVDGTPCTPYVAADGHAECSYGSDPRPQCRTVAECQSRTYADLPPATWQVSRAACSTSPLPAACR